MVFSVIFGTLILLKNVRLNFSLRQIDVDLIFMNVMKLTSTFIIYDDEHVSTGWWSSIVNLRDDGGSTGTLNMYECQNVKGDKMGGGVLTRKFWIPQRRDVNLISQMATTSRKQPFFPLSYQFPPLGIVTSCPLRGPSKKTRSTIIRDPTISNGQIAQSISNVCLFCVHRRAYRWKIIKDSNIKGRDRQKGHV